jgi:SWI/SNF-related matrix-associated actin-dependent regulator of chromatin subfamily A member 5
MLDRIRRKLFLSVKVMGGSDNPASSETQLGRSDVMDILRKGSSALSGADDGMSLERFLEAPISDILTESRSRENVRDAKMKKELDADGCAPTVVIDEKLLLDAEAEERALLSGVALVQSRLFEGKVVENKNNKQIADEWQELQKRARADRLVIVNGIAVIADQVLAVRFVSWKESITWLTSHQPLTENAPPVKKRERQKYESEDYCNHCRDGGELLLCSTCPRGNVSLAHKFSC